MALQSSNTMLASEVFIAIRNNAGGWKAQAQNANASLAAGSVTSEFVFRILDSLKGCRYSDLMESRRRFGQLRDHGGLRRNDVDRLYGDDHGCSNLHQLGCHELPKCQWIFAG